MMSSVVQNADHITIPALFRDPKRPIVKGVNIGARIYQGIDCAAVFTGNCEDQGYVSHRMNISPST